MTKWDLLKLVAFLDSPRNQKLISHLYKFNKIKLSNWMFKVMLLLLINQSALFQCT